MSRRPKPRRSASAPPASRRMSARSLLAIGAFAVALLAGGWWMTERRAATVDRPNRPETTSLQPEEAGLPSPGATGTGTAAGAAAGASAGLAPSIVVGRWQRLEGGYVLDIASVAADGAMTAAYLNPRSINVAAARASRSGTTIEVFVELRDLNYPGATYRLAYDAATDRLAGQYHQPALRQTFDVIFVRAAR